MLYGLRCKAIFSTYFPLYCNCKVVEKAPNFLLHCVENCRKLKAARLIICGEKCDKHIKINVKIFIYCLKRNRNSLPVVAL